jgi:hypothetical protein
MLAQKVQALLAPQIPNPKSQIPNPKQMLNAEEIPKSKRKRGSGTSL